MADLDDRTYIRVHDGMPDHPKIDGLSDRAFRLLIETWCWSSRHLTDGQVPAKVWAKRGTPATRRELVAAQLVQEHPDHVAMHDYLEHQRSAEEVDERKTEKKLLSQRGNHTRWHIGPGGKPNPECAFCTSPPTPVRESNKGSPARDPAGESETASVGHRSGIPFASLETETETEKEVLPSEALPAVDHLGGDRPESNARATPTPPPKPADQHKRPPDHCPNHANLDDPPPCRACANARERAETWDTTDRRRQAHAISQQAHERARINGLAIQTCTLCDTTGYRPGGRVCDHDPNLDERTARGAALVKAALTQTGRTVAAEATG